MKRKTFLLRSLFYILFFVLNLSALTSSPQKTEQTKVDKNVPTVFNSFNPTPRQGQPTRMYITEDLRIGDSEGRDDREISHYLRN